MGRPFSRRRFLTTTGGVCAAGMLPPPAAAQDDIVYFRIGTGSTGGTYFPIGGVIANAISNPPGSRPCDLGGSCGVPGLIAIVQSTQGSIQNVKDMAAGRIESGFVQADIAYWAYSGQRMFQNGGPIRSLRVIASLYPEALHIVVRKDSGIKTVGDLRDKRVCVGEPDSGTLVHARAVLHAYGLGRSTVKESYLKPLAAADALRDGKIDAFFFVAGEPASAITTLADTIPLALVPVTGQSIERVLQRYPFLTSHTIAAGTYKDVPATQTISVRAQWLVNASVEPNLVYGITKALWNANTRRLLDRGHPEGRRIQLDTARVGLIVPLHEGAARFYDGLKSAPLPDDRKTDPDAPPPDGTPGQKAPAPADD